MSPSVRQKFLPTPADRQLAAELKRRRHAAGLSQRKLAKRIGVSFHTVYRVETLQRPVSLQALRRIEELLGSLTGPPNGVQGVAGKETVTDKEKVLLALFRSVPEDEQDSLLGRAVSTYMSSARRGTLLAPVRIEALEKSDPGLARVLKYLDDDKH